MDTFELLGLGIYAWITIATVLTMFSLLLFTKLRTDLVFLGTSCGSPKPSTGPSYD